MVRAEGGFTLVELLVAMVAAIIVIIGASTIMIVTMHQTQRTFSTVDATRQARTALGNIENELHSACVDGESPIEGVTSGGTVESNASNLVFLTYTGTSADPTPIWNQLSLNATTKTLTDSTYNVSGTGPDWTQGSLISTTTVLSNVAQNGSTPVFQYFAYEAAYTDSSGNVYYAIPDGINVTPVTGTALALNALPTSSGLSSANAATVVEVMVSLLVGPTSENLNNVNLTSIDDPVTDSISLRLTTPPDYVPAGSTPEDYGPCE